MKITIDVKEGELRLIEETSSGELVAVLDADFFGKLGEVILDGGDTVWTEKAHFSILVTRENALINGVRELLDKK